MLEYQRSMLINALFTEPILFFAIVIGIVYAITVHEFSHALGAYIQGDRTARDMGRLTLNPMAHLDPLGFILVLLAGFGWGKPTPFNPYNLRMRRFGPAIVGLFGPLSNMLSGLVFGLLLLFVTRLELAANTFLPSFLSIIVLVNFMLGLFNLIPIPPLDGSKIFFPLFPPSWEGLKMNLERYGAHILISVIVLDSLFRLRIFGFVQELAAAMTGLFFGP